MLEIEIIARDLCNPLRSFPKVDGLGNYICLKSRCCTSSVLITSQEPFQLYCRASVRVVGFVSNAIHVSIDLPTDNLYV